MQHLLVLIDQLSDCGIELQHIDIGGGLGVCYQDEVVPSLDTYMALYYLYCKIVITPDYGARTLNCGQCWGITNTGTGDKK